MYFSAFCFSSVSIIFGSRFSFFFIHRNTVIFILHSSFFCLLFFRFLFSSVDIFLRFLFFSFISTLSFGFNFDLFSLLFIYHFIILLFFSNLFLYLFYFSTVPIFFGLQVSFSPDLLFFQRNKFFLIFL